MRELLTMLKDPSGFFEKTRREHIKPALKFFLEVTLILAIATPVVNYLGIESTDFSSSYQAQIMAFRFTKTYLLPMYGVYAYLIEPILIFGFAFAILAFLVLFLHAVYKAMGSKGPISNALKAVCYGVGPCIVGFLPYISLFAAIYAFILQFYIGPKTLYGVSEAKATLFLTIAIALAFIEMFVFGTTVPEFN